MLLCLKKTETFFMEVLFIKLGKIYFEMKDNNNKKTVVGGEVKVLKDIPYDEKKQYDNTSEAKEKISLISQHVHEILRLIGENTERDGLKKTPERYAKALLEILSGYNENPYEIINGAIFKQEYDGIVTVSNIRFFSMCEHHILPFFGVVSVSYIPRGKIIGLSKIPRIVRLFSSRLQVQERLTSEIGKFLENTVNPKGVAVYVSAVHLCLAMRGAKKEDAKMETLYLSGEFRNNAELQNIFFEHVKKNGDKIVY